MDNTSEILATFAHDYLGQVTLIHADLEEAKTPSALRGGYSFANLAYLRNLLLEQFLSSDCEALFSVDSDIMVSPTSLTRLLEADKDIISTLVCNGHEIGDVHCYNILNRLPDGSWVHVKHFPRHTLFQVDCTGAAVLIQRKVIEEYGVRYSAAYGPEDIGFCLAASSKGIKIYCDGRIELEHIMLRPRHSKVHLTIHPLTTLSIE